MILVNDVINYANRLKDIIPAINYAQTVIDETQMVKTIGDRYTEDNFLLFLVIPSMVNEGSQDQLKKNNQMALMLLKKSDSQDALDTLLEEMHATQVCVKEIETQMLKDQDDPCYFMRWLEGESIQIDPVWGYAGCNGWSLKFSVKTSL